MLACITSEWIFGQFYLLSTRKLLIKLLLKSQFIVMIELQLQDINNCAAAISYRVAGDDLVVGCGSHHHYCAK